MSVRLMGAVFGLSIGPMDKLVLLAMADHARDDGSGCYPSVRTLASKCSLDRRSVQRIMARLERAGRIVASGRAVIGRGKTVEYRVEISEKGGVAPLFPVHKGRRPGSERAAPVQRKGGTVPPETLFNRPEPSLLDFAGNRLARGNEPGNPVENHAQDPSARPDPAGPDKAIHGQIAALAGRKAVGAPGPAVGQLRPSRADFQRAIFRRAVSSALHDTWLRSRSDDRQACVDGLNLAARAAADSLLENRRASLHGLSADALVAATIGRIGPGAGVIFAVSDFTARISAATAAILAAVAEAAIELLAANPAGTKRR